MALRVVFVSDFPQASGSVSGGVEGVTQCLADAMCAAGDVELHIVAPCSNRKPGVEMRNGATVHWIQKSKIPGFMSYWTTFRAAVHECLRSIQPDIVHFQGIAGWTLGYKGPYVFTVHGIPEKDVLYVDKPLPMLRSKVVSLVERLGRKRASDVIVINPYVMEVVGNQITGQTWHIENPVNSEFFEISRAYVAGRILYVGRLSRLKNVLGLIRAFAKVYQVMPEATLHIAGTPDNADYHDQCMQEVTRQNLGYSVTFLGNIDRKSLAEALSQAECMALVSLQENAPMIVSEAMAAGVPVVASDRCGIPYMVENGRTGFLVDPLDEQLIADKLLGILKDPVLGAAMSLRSRELALERFHANKVAGKTVEVYRSVLGR